MSAISGAQRNARTAGFDIARRRLRSAPRSRGSTRRASTMRRSRPCIRRGSTTFFSFSADNRCAPRTSSA